MQYWGKLLGLILGYMSGTGFWGIVSGLLIGHMFDTARAAKRRGYFTDQQTRQTIFFRTTFEVMGNLTKSKGRVTEADIQIASLYMERMQLHGEQRNAAQRAFRDERSQLSVAGKNARIAQCVFWSFRPDTDFSGNSNPGGICRWVVAPQ